MKSKSNTNITKTRVRQHSLAFRTGPAIKKLRTECNMTQQQLANKLNISRSSVGNWEACLRTPKAEQYSALADLFNVDISTLY